MEFYDELYKLKNLVRRGWILRDLKDSKTQRMESDAEHCFSMALFALEIIKKEKLDLDELKVLKMILFHEIGEIDAGDYTPADKISKEEKYNKEFEGVKRVSKEYNMPEILDIWLEYEQNSTKEAQFCKKIDKLDTIKQCIVYAKQTGNKNAIDEFLTNGKERIKGFEKYVKIED